MKRNRIRLLATGILGLLALLLILAPARAGNKELMDEWSRKKQQVKDKVYEQLKREGRIPKDGTVYFEARTKADPADTGKVLIEVDSVRVEPSAPASASAPKKPPAKAVPGGASASAPAQTSLPFASGNPGEPAPGLKGGSLGVPGAGQGTATPQTPPTLVRYETLNIPVGAVFQESMRIKNGAIQPDPPAQGKKP